MYQNESIANPKIPLLLKRLPNKNETNNRVVIGVKYCKKVEGKPKKKFDIKLSDVSELSLKYFFAHDHLNSAHQLPMYIATMQNVKANYPKL